MTKSESDMSKALPNFRFSLVYFVLFTLYGVATPYLQILVQGLGYGPAAVGFLLGLFEVAGLAGPLLLGGLSDRARSPRPVLLGLALASMLALLPLILVPRFLVTMLSLALLAVGIRTLIPFTDAAAVAFGEASGRRRGSAGYGKIRVFGSAGFIVTAVVLQSIPGFDKSPPWRIAVYMAVGAAAFCASLLLLPKAGTVAAAVAGEGAAAGPRPRTLGGIRGIDPVFLLGVAVIALGRIAMAPITSFLSLYVVDDLKWNAVGALWALSACAEMPLMVLAGGIIRRTGAMGAIAIASVAVALRLAIYAIFPSPGGVIAGQLLHSLCYGLFQPAAVAFVALRIPPEQRSRGMAVFTSLGVGLPTFLGSSLGGLVVQAAGYRVLFAVYTVFAAASVGLYLAARRRFAERG